MQANYQIYFTAFTRGYNFSTLCYIEYGVHAWIHFDCFVFCYYVFILVISNVILGRIWGCMLS